jgi:hypothetical protein
MDNDLVGELQCPVCLELLTWPIILPCSHILCRDPCGERLFTHGFIRCPVRLIFTGKMRNLTAKLEFSQHLRMLPCCFYFTVDSRCTSRINGTLLLEGKQR